MKTQPINPNAAQENVEPRIRTVRTIWIALLGSIGMYYALTIFVGRPEDVEPNPTLSLILLVIALSTTVVSFLIKSRLIRQAIQKQQVQLVQQAYVAAWTITEVAALLGIIDLFFAAHRHYYLLIIIAVCGLLLHFPRREHFINAAFNRMTGP